MKPLHLLSLAILLTFSSCALFYPKDIGRNTVADLKEDIEELTSEERIKGIVKSAVEGALEGTSSEESEQSLNELVDILTKSIIEKINPALDTLNTKAPAENLVNGAIDALSSEANKAKIDSLLADVFKSADSNLTTTIEDLEGTINKTISGIIANLENEVKGLDKVIAEMFSQALQDSVSSFINGAIAGIDMEAIGNKIATELLTKQLKDTLGVMIKGGAEKATEPLDSVLDLLKKNLITVAVVVVGLLFLLYWFRRKFLQKDHDMKHAQAFANEMTKAIESLSSEVDTELETKVKERLSDHKNYDKYKDI